VKKTESEEDRIFKPPESPHSQAGAEISGTPRVGQRPRREQKAQLQGFFSDCGIMTFCPGALQRRQNHRGQQTNDGDQRVLRRRLLLTWNL
jgi:hypothetical protein